MFRRVLLIAALVLAPLALNRVALAQPGDAPMEQRIPFKKSEESTSGLVLRVVGGLFVVALVGVGALFLLKRYLPAGYLPASQGAKRINVLEVRRLTPKVTLFLVEVDGVRILLSQNGERIANLHRYSSATPPERHVDT